MIETEKFIDYLQEALLILGYKICDQKDKKDCLTVTKSGKEIVFDREKILFMVGYTTGLIEKCIEDFLK